MVQEARDFEALRAELEARTRELQMGGGGEVDRSLEERKAAGPPGLGQHRVEKVLEANRLWPATPVSPDIAGIETFPTLEEVERMHLLADWLQELRPREQKLLRLRYGLGEEPPKTLEEIGRLFGVTRERIRQIELGAIRKLRRMAAGRRIPFTWLY